MSLIGLEDYMYDIYDPDRKEPLISKINMAISEKEQIVKRLDTKISQFKKEIDSIFDKLLKIK